MGGESRDVTCVMEGEWAACNTLAQWRASDDDSLLNFRRYDGPWSGEGMKGGEGKGFNTL